jgi:hypothetical protein
VKPETEPTESERDLKIELFSANIEAAPTFAPRPIARPLNNEPAMLREALSDLMNEDFFADPEDRPTEALRLMV